MKEIKIGAPVSKGYATNDYVVRQLEVIVLISDLFESESTTINYCGDNIRYFYTSIARE